MTISNSLENKCPICNNDLKRWEGGLICAEFFQTTELFFNHKQDILNLKENKLNFHICLKRSNSLAIQYIKKDNNIVNEIYWNDRKLSVFLDFESLVKYTGIPLSDLDFFTGVKNYDDAILKINKLRIFS